MSSIYTGLGLGPTRNGTELVSCKPITVHKYPIPQTGTKTLATLEGALGNGLS
jgi:hypothetical protein